MGWTQTPRYRRPVFKRPVGRYEDPSLEFPRAEECRAYRSLLKLKYDHVPDIMFHIDVKVTSHGVSVWRLTGFLGIRMRHRETIRGFFYAVCMGNPTPLILLPNSRVHHLDYWHSDHRPLLVEALTEADSVMDGDRCKQRSFHFESCWANLSDCRDLITRNWHVSVNDTHIALIPKVTKAERIIEHRPISLCNVIYKIVAKAMGNQFRYMMIKLGFPDSWVSQVMRCVSSVSFSFLVNGDICGNVRPSRDDSMLFTSASESDCQAIRQMLDDYSKASGQLVNFDKFIMCVSRSVTRAIRDRLAAIIGVRRVRCHERYLGLLSFAGRFGGVAQRVKMQWASWSRLFAGKVSGGLGFRDLNAFNKALLAKQCWRLIWNQSSLVAQSVGDVVCWAEVFLTEFYEVNKPDLVQGLPLQLSPIRWKPPDPVRNQLVHNLEVKGFDDVVTWASNFLEEWNSTQHIDKPSLLDHELVVKWIPLEDGVWEINMDAANCYQNQKIGLGIIIRNKSEVVKAAASLRIQAMFSPLVAEAIAVWQGILLASNSGLFLPLLILALPLI
ncbi:hypothetical protein Dsin_005956 [Dipteronia sinensis]|uniref:RNase H type-1 domain-containing protein n=1 Tax=Dipteronia sinensis TaxID=43782 RepID=A0AAE0AYS5_9ROSI|nr:hypothetical protein Dsin_005956 [Dipteronia sinensis]